MGTPLRIKVVELDDLRFSPKWELVPETGPPRTQVFSEMPCAKTAVIFLIKSEIGEGSASRHLRFCEDWRDLSQTTWGSRETVSYPMGTG